MFNQSRWRTVEYRYARIERDVIAVHRYSVYE